MQSSSSRRPRKPRRRWRWHIPPALMDAGESLEGIQILEEHPGALGLVLWETFRDVMLWAAVPEEERAGLFAAGAYEARVRRIEGCGADASLRTLVTVAAEVCRRPEGADPAEVMASCRGIADWAERRDSLRTAVALSTAAAVAAPRNAIAALRVGEIARKNGEHARGETWFRRTIGLGRQASDWAAYSEAFLGLAELYVQRGNFPAARRFYVRALRASRRHALRELQGRTLHGLFGVAVDSGEHEAAEELAVEAFRAYGHRNPRLPLLAQDVAYFWLVQGSVRPALEVFRAVLPHLHDPCDRLVCLGLLGRAAGAAGDRPEFGEAWDAVWAHASDWGARPRAAQAILHLAHGAAALGDWARAERAAGTARDQAGRRGEAQVVLSAEAVQEAVARKRPAPPAPVRGRAAEAPPLAEELVRSLEMAAAE